MRVGGIAVGFAARDLLANLFGGLTIYLDRPFSVGDWIRSPDRQIEGVVERIGWRSTVVRRFDKRPLYVPNSVFSTVVVENPSRMTNRRIYETIGLRYDDARVVGAITDAVRAVAPPGARIPLDAPATPEAVLRACAALQGEGLEGDKLAGDNLEAGAQP